MDASEALREIRGKASAGRIFITRHANQRMSERRVQYGDVKNALTNAKSARWQPDKKNWRVAGPDLDNEELTVAVDIEDDVIVVTVF